MSVVNKMGKTLLLRAKWENRKSVHSKHIRKREQHVYNRFFFLHTFTTECYQARCFQYAINTVTLFLSYKHQLDT